MNQHLKLHTTHVCLGLFRIAVASLTLLFVALPLHAQKQETTLFSDVQEFRRSLGVAPKAAAVKSDYVLFEAHLNAGLGAEFNGPMSLTAIFCQRATALKSIESSLAASLKDQGYDTFAGWDKFGFLIAEKSTHAAIFKVPPLYEDIKLHVKIDQDDFDERAITIDYEIRAGLRANDQASWADQSSSNEAKQYIDDLRGELRQATETALKSDCLKLTAKDIRSKEDGINALARESQLSRSQLKSVESALEKHNE